MADCKPNTPEDSFNNSLCLGQGLGQEMWPEVLPHFFGKSVLGMVLYF